ncbi:SGNH/GDSL hydrolase family protein [Paenibacillus sp. J5C_2022]|uniref:SGNH/GDSL hydrolase family protein n=1 Tax=Paenibacillus sp. J5C2022 TaxID=2977129 RepID=UPI0021D0C49A|nr:SGNH/GDSL hydrolase family protein [Paenibacillus sp. J5C2022]MCU6709685.1 SGNH/GDSL hydrolase family protein [Paenibacillus sp. J5C2022]
MYGLKWIQRLRQDLREGNTVSIVAYGDSWTFGSVAEGWHEARARLDATLIHGSWASQLGEELLQNNANLSFFNEGVRGRTALKGHDAFADMMDRCKPAYIVLNFGINDWKGDVSIADYTAAMERMIKQALAADCGVVLWTSGPLSTCTGRTYGWDQPVEDHAFPHRFEEFNAVLHSLAAQFDLPLADAAAGIEKLWEDGSDLSGWFFDAFHFKQEGHDFIYRSLSSLLLHEN